MSERPGRSIVVADLGRERGGMVRALLEPVAPVRLVSDLPDEAAVGAALLVVVPPRHGLDGAQERRLLALARHRATLLLGPLPVESGWPPTVRGFPGHLLPSSLKAVVLELLGTQPAAPADWRRALAAGLPLGESDRALLERAARARAPVLLVGEPGTGKAWTARTLLTAPGGRCLRLEGPLDRPLAVAAAPLAPGDTLYLLGPDRLDREQQAELLDWLDGGGPAVQLVVALTELGRPASLRDDLRLRLEAVVVPLQPVRAGAGLATQRFLRILAALAVRFDVEPPALAAEVPPAIDGYPWPLNFDEQVTVATRVLFAASGRPATLADLDLPAGAAPAGLAAGRSRPPGEPPSLDTLVQDLAHQIKNPLVSIKTFTQLLPERYDDPEFRDEFRKVVEHDVTRIDAVLGELAEFARLRQPQWQTVDLAALLGRLLDVHIGPLQAQEIRLLPDLPPQPVEVWSDADLLGYALQVSLREAIQTIPAGGRLEVQLQPAAAAPAGVTTVHLRFRAEADASRGLRGQPRGERREVLGLRHSLAAHVLGRLGAGFAIEDTVDGETRISVTFDER